MSYIIDKTFKEWTEGRDPVASRINIYEHVRDINYAVIPEIRNYDKGPEEMLAGMRGSCTPKHFLLGMFYERLGLAVKYVTYPFTWNDPEIAYPDELRRASEKLPTEYHLALIVSLEREPVLVDATWDLALADVGFPVNKRWDGLSDTLLAVKPEGEIIHASAAEREDYVDARKSKWTDEEHARMGYFYNELNRWLEAVRTYGG